MTHFKNFNFPNPRLQPTGGGEGYGILFRQTEKGKKMKRRIVSSHVAAMAMGVMAETVNTVTVTKFNQSYPYAGKATVEYTVGGPLPANAVAKITLSEDGTSATFTQENVVAGANTNVIDFASSFGGALLLTNASFVVTIVADFGGVQLWENGPYWADCNVGAARPEESGYYFWWGDTVGYKRENDAWVASDGSSSDFRFRSENTPTDGKNNATLQSEGYIDATGNLAAAHDAATVHLGAPWRMPTDAEIVALIANCTFALTTTNGVSGWRVMGKDAYADRSIFLPAAGYGEDLSLNAGSNGYYWSSSGVAGFGRALIVSSDNFIRSILPRSAGQSVRPVRDAD